MKKSTATSRRSFLKATALAALSPCLSELISTTAHAEDIRRDRIPMGFIGLGGMGMWDAGDMNRNGFRIVSVCDLREKTLEAALGNKDIVPDGEQVKSAKDYRRLLDDKEIEAIGIATPDHWHVKMAVEALQAGKHVFCQKPLTLTLEENQIVRKAAAKYDRVFYVGTQQRADRGRFLTAVAMIRKGLLGEIRNITVGIDGSPSGGPFAAESIPEGFDWSAWLGQAPMVAYTENRANGNFRWWYEYSGGKFTDWGAHHLDIALWALGEDRQGTGPVRIDGTKTKHPVPFEKGRPTVGDCYNTCTEFEIPLTFRSGTTITVTNKPPNGLLFEGAKGRIFVNRGRLTGKPIEDGLHRSLEEKDFVALYKGMPIEWNKANFARCIREGGEPLADVPSHVMTMNACHLCSIAARLGRPIEWNPETEQLGDDEAGALASVERRDKFDIPTL